MIAQVPGLSSDFTQWEMALDLHMLWRETESTDASAPKQYAPKIAHKGIAMIAKTTGCSMCVHTMQMDSNCAELILGSMFQLQHH